MQATAKGTDDVNAADKLAAAEKTVHGAAVTESNIATTPRRTNRSKNTKFAAPKGKLAAAAEAKAERLFHQKKEFAEDGQKAAIESERAAAVSEGFAKILVGEPPGHNQDSHGLMIEAVAEIAIVEAAATKEIAFTESSANAPAAKGANTKASPCGGSGWRYHTLAALGRKRSARVRGWQSPRQRKRCEWNRRRTWCMRKVVLCL